MNSQPVIGVVGSCKSGKSTLARGLTARGYKAKQILQEHSFAPSMWQRIGKPDVLIYLHCTYESSLTRGITWKRSEYEAQFERLAHARQHADLELRTDEAPPEKVLESAVDFLRKAGY